jgi:hypothetical protein
VPPLFTLPLPLPLVLSSATVVVEAGCVDDVTRRCAPPSSHVQLSSKHLESFGIAPTPVSMRRLMRRTARSTSRSLTAEDQSHDALSPPSPAVAAADAASP